MDWGQRAVTETAQGLEGDGQGLLRPRAERRPISPVARPAAAWPPWKPSRFPKDFDGIISGAPALDYTSLVATFFAWATKANLGQDGKPILTRRQGEARRRRGRMRPATRRTASRTASISDPRAMRLQAERAPLQAGPELRMPDRARRSAFSRSGTHGPKDCRGRQLYPGGIPVGSEPYWPRWLTGSGKAPALMPLFGQDFIRYMAFEPAAGLVVRGRRTYDFDRDPRGSAPWRRIYNAATFNPDRPAEVRAPTCPPSSRPAARSSSTTAGPTRSLPPSSRSTSTRRSPRRPAAASPGFRAPLHGAGHGPLRHRPGRARDRRYRHRSVYRLERWVEEGQAPTELVARKVVAGQTRLDAPDLPLSAGDSLQGHGRREGPGELQLRRALS